MLTAPFSPSTGRVPRPRASGVAVAGPWHEKSGRSRTGHRARSRFSRVGPRRPTASSHDQPGRSHPDPESRSARKHSSPSGAEYAARYAPQESDSDFVSCQASVYKNTTSRAPRLPGSRRRQDQEPEAKFGRLARLRPIHGFNSRWQNPRGVRPAIHPGQTTGSETHAAFGRRSIPAEPRRFAPLIVAFRSKYTRASSPSGAPPSRALSAGRLAPTGRTGRSRRSRGFHHRLLGQPRTRRPPAPPRTRLSGASRRAASVA